MTHFAFDSYQHYLKAASSYDATRLPVGVEVLTGCLAQGPRPLAQMAVLDAGCGTGNYSAALLEQVGRIDALDINPQMLQIAADKLSVAASAGRIAFHRGGLEELPFEAATFDGVMLNQVLHHLPDSVADGYPLHRRVFAEFARVLRPGGVLVVNTCSHIQLRRGFWYYDLIPEARERVIARHIPVEELADIFVDSGFSKRGRIAPLDALIQGRNYFNAAGPLSEEWRNGDSMWGFVEDTELERVLEQMHELETNGRLEEYVKTCDAGRADSGQITFLFAVRE